MSKKQRPPCPDCGSINIISKGISWLCKDCGRWWQKQYRSERAEVPVNNHLPVKGEEMVLT